MKLSIIKIGSSPLTPTAAKHKRAILTKVRRLKGDNAIRGIELKQSMHISDDLWSVLMSDAEVSKYTACSTSGRVFAHPDTIKTCKEELGWK